METMPRQQKRNEAGAVTKARQVTFLITRADPLVLVRSIMLRHNVGKEVGKAMIAAVREDDLPRRLNQPLRYRVSFSTRIRLASLAISVASIIR